MMLCKRNARTVMFVCIGDIASQKYRRCTAILCCATFMTKCDRKLHVHLIYIVTGYTGVQGHLSSR